MGFIDKQTKTSNQRIRISNIKTKKVAMQYAMGNTTDDNR
jgi:hypothetical protein